MTPRAAAQPRTLRLPRTSPPRGSRCSRSAPSPSAPTASWSPACWRGSLDDLRVASPLAGARDRLLAASRARRARPRDRPRPDRRPHRCSRSRCWGSPRRTRSPRSRRPAALLLVAACLAAVAAAAYTPSAFATAALLAPPSSWRGRALSVVSGGLTVALVVGVLLGTLIGRHAGWRATFWGGCRAERARAGRRARDAAVAAGAAAGAAARPSRSAESPRDAADPRADARRDGGQLRRVHVPSRRSSTRRPGRAATSGSCSPSTGSARCSATA